MNGVSVYVTDPSVIDAINALDCVSTVRNCPNDLKAQEQKERWLANEMKPVPAQRGTKGFYGGAEDQVTQLNVNLLHDMGLMRPS